MYEVFRDYLLFEVNEKQRPDFEELIDENKIQDFFPEEKLKNKATSNIKTQNILPSLAKSDEGISLKDDSFKTDRAIVNLHPSKEKHWVLYLNQSYFASTGGPSAENLSKFIIKRNRI